jgi:ubiquinone/menaquinone biosynthesis C-methylase UbiE
MGPTQRKFRRSRARLIKQYFPGIEGSTVVDIGGSWPFWNTVNDILRPARVLIFNISSARTTMSYAGTLDHVETHLYDGKHLPLEDRGADYVICNSVIEHVPLDERAGLAREIRRVARNYVVQTPSAAFPVELHFMMPGLQWLPRQLARKLVPITPFSLLQGGNMQGFFDETRLLSKRELIGYFPDAHFHAERFLGIPKSNLMIGRS